MRPEIVSHTGPDCHLAAGQRYENATLCRDWFSHTSAWRAGFASRWRDYILSPSPTTKWRYEVAGTVRHGKLDFHEADHVSGVSWR